MEQVTGIGGVFFEVKDPKEGISITQPGVARNELPRVMSSPKGLP